MDDIASVVHTQQQEKVRALRWWKQLVYLLPDNSQLGTQTDGYDPESRAVVTLLYIT